MTSVMITSAPSRAQVTAWARPCPRAPPVMRATLPSSIPIATPVEDGGAFAARAENCAYTDGMQEEGRLLDGSHDNPLTALVSFLSGNPAGCVHRRVRS